MDASAAAIPTEPGPVFLAGADRSGIGLLGELLERHPRLAMTRRTDFWTRFRGRYGDLRAPENVDRCLRAMASDRRTGVFEPDRDRLLADLAEDPTYPRLFELLQRQRMEQLARARWGDKSLGSERHAELILRSYPTARMIHVVRDPRDRYASQKHHRRAGRGGASAGAAVWCWSVRLAERHARRHPERYLIVRYESLVRDPERTLRDVCAFIGEEYPSDLIDGLASPSPPRDDVRELGGPGPIHNRSVGRFRELLTPQEVAILQLAAGRRLARFGYEQEPVELTGTARLRFLLTLPSNAVRMVLWAPWAWVQLLVGRPSPR